MPGCAQMSEAATTDLDSRDLISPHEFASRSGLSIATVRRYLADGRLPSMQPGGPRCRVLIPVSALTQFAGKAGDRSLSRPLPVANATVPASAGRSLPGPAPRWLSQK